MQIIKRNGQEVNFDKQKIENAITKANNEVLESEQLSIEEIRSIADIIENACTKFHRAMNIEEIQDMVETEIMKKGAYEVARRYINYRYTHHLIRQSNTTDEKILSLIDCCNEDVKQENSNKNPTINSVQRDYMAGEVSKDLTNRILLPPDIVKAHEEGLIHFHDADYYAQRMHNCFHANTEFLTSSGTKKFKDFRDGEKVEIIDKNGSPRVATVRKYGKQKMNVVTFKTATMTKEVVCTPNHRWFLSNGEVTTSLKVGDKLLGINENKQDLENLNYKQADNLLWRVDSISLYRDGTEFDAWCVEEPITHSFMLADGMITGNCDLVNLEDMLQNGTVISGTMIEKPHSFSTACNISTQIIAQVASSQYGGQSISLTHLAPFVDVSRKKIRKHVKKELEFLYNTSMTDDEINTTIDTITETRVRDEINRGVQMLQYQVITLMTTNGQAPFITFFMYLNEAKDARTKHDLALIIEEVLNQRIQGVKNEKGVWITPAFPKLIYVLEEDNMSEDAPYWYLTELSAKCTAKRMVPDYISEKIMKQNKVDKNGDGHCYTAMGCRSFLTPFVDENNKSKYYGRFNQGVVTINLVDIGLSANKNIDKFWEIFDERMELCHKALQCRHERLTGTTSDVAPILWQYGALSRLKKGEKIDSLLHGGYSTLSLGYAGLWECVYGLIGKKLTEPEGKELGLLIMKKLNEYTTKWKKAENIDYSPYGTPLESTTYKFAKCLQRRFGNIPDVTDKNYITNSYHVHVTEPIDAFDKLSLEAEFQALSPGGAISYIEVPNMQNNIPAVLTVMKFIYDNIMYAELNTKSDYCQVCGYDGEILIKENDNGKLIWECPNCGNKDQTKMNVARRTCGYIGTQFWNQGRTQEIQERVCHL